MLQNSSNVFACLKNFIKKALGRKATKQNKTTKPIYTKPSETYMTNKLPIKTNLN